MSDIWMGWIKRESGSKGYACMGDSGRAWGLYQFDYRYALIDFLNFCIARNPVKYADLKTFANLGKASPRLVGNTQLRAVWTAHAADQEFCDLQDEYARAAYYEPAAKYLYNLYSIDAEKHSAALRGSLFSFAIRSGQLVGARKFSGGGATEEELLRRAYAKYGTEDAGRWPLQLADALAYLETEMPAGKRNVYIAVFESFYGLNRSDGSHKVIIDLYNTYLPHPRGYKAQYTDAFCAETASAAAIKAGVADIFPIECGCEEMIELAKAAGIWIEDDAHIPIKAELIFYDWDDDGAGDCTGHADHVGAVVEVEGRTIKVIEGNKNGAVGYRRIDVDSKCIRGYASPHYEELDNMANYETLKIGSSGESVRKWQRGLMLLGFCDCQDYTKRNFADGDFKGRTEGYTREFQEGFRIRYNLTVNGIVDMDDWIAMETEVARAEAANAVIDFTVDDFMEACQERTDYFWLNGYTYGCPPVAPWWHPERKETACDRYLGEVLKKLKKEPGNRDVEGLIAWLPAFGAEKISHISDINAAARRGDIIIANNEKHVLICAGKNLRYDCGSKDRIKLTGDYAGYKSQPFNESISNEGDPYIFRLPFKSVDTVTYTEPDTETEEVLVTEDPDDDAEKYKIILKEVKHGSKGTSVRILQMCLKALGYYTGRIDGDFWDLTDTALREYQADKIAEGYRIGGNDGRPDGVCGAGSWTCLLGVEAVLAD